MEPTQTCGFCLRFDRNTMPNLQHLGKCKFCDLEELAADTKVCEHYVTEIKVQRERRGFYVNLLPCGEREGPFPTDNSIDHVKLAAKLGLKPKQIWLANVQVPSQKYDMFKETQFLILDKKTKGITIRQCFFLEVKTSKHRWRFRLYKIKDNEEEIRKENLEPITGWISLTNVEDLRISQRAKAIRSILNKTFKDSDVTLETVIMAIQDHMVEWQERKEGTVDQEKPGKIPKAELPTSEEVSDVFAYEGDRKFNSRIQIKSLGFPKARFLDLKIRYKYTDASGEEVSDEHNLNFEKNFDASAFATYFDSNSPKSAFIVLRQKGTIQEGSYVSAKGTKETAITQAVVSDRQGNEAKSWFVHSHKCDLRRQPNWIFAEGWLCRGKYGRIGVLVSGFQNESEVMMPDEKTVKTSKEYLRAITTEEEPTVWKIARVMKKKSNLKGKETTKGFVADFLLVGSPVWTKTPEGPAILSMTSCELGGTTTAKSQRIREMIRWLRAGKYESGRKTSAGLAAGAEKIEGMGWVARKGLLPSADLSFLIIDNMFPHALDEYVESRRNGIIMLTTIKPCELWARTRLKLLSNPTIPLDQHLHKCVALKIYDRKFIARFTFATFTYGVEPEIRYNPGIEELTEEDETLLNTVWNVLRWNLSQEITYTVPLKLWRRIMELSKQLELKFGNEEIPLFLRANPHKIATLAYCFALFEGAEPGERHVDQAYQWLVQCGTDMELDEFTAQWKEDHTLSDEEYESLSKTINEKIVEEMRIQGGEFTETLPYKFLKYVAKHGEAPMEEIAASISVSDKTIKNRAKEMKGLGLIKSARKGYFFTAKGVRFYKRWLKDMNNGYPVCPVYPDSKGQPPFGEEKKQNLDNFTGKKGVTSRNGVDGVNGETAIVIDKTPKGPIALQKPKPHETIAGNVKPLKPIEQGQCTDCGKERALTHTLNKNGSSQKICSSCAHLRSHFKKGTQFEFEYVALDAGLTRREAGERFQQLVEEQKLGRDKEGLCRWI